METGRSIQTNRQSDSSVNADYYTQWQRRYHYYQQRLLEFEKKQAEFQRQQAHCHQRRLAIQMQREDLQQVKMAQARKRQLTIPPF